MKFAYLSHLSALHYEQDSFNEDISEPERFPAVGGLFGWIECHVDQDAIEESANEQEASYQVLTREQARSSLGRSLSDELAKASAKLAERQERQAGQPQMTPDQEHERFIESLER